MTGQQPISSEEELNLSSGISRTLLERIVEKEVHEQARNKALEEQKEAIRLKRIANFKEGTRVTAGIKLMDMDAILIVKFFRECRTLITREDRKKRQL